MDPKQPPAAAFPHALTVEAPQAGTRLDRFVADAFPGAGRAAVARLIGAGGVVVNGRRARKGDAVAAGDVVALSAEPGPVVAVADPQVQLSVVHEDAQLVVVDKAAGQPSHPLQPGELGTLCGGLLARYPEMAQVGYHGREPGLLHRLDVGTSGLLLAARDAATFAALRGQLVDGGIHKEYLAVCAGELAAPVTLRGYLDASGPTVHMRDPATPASREVTLEVLGAHSGARPGTSVVRVSAPFAARHQIRAQLATAGYPLLGDVRYGGPEVSGVEHHLLHACVLRFEHPVGGAVVELTSEAPEVFARFA